MNKTRPHWVLILFAFALVCLASTVAHAQGRLPQCAQQSDVNCVLYVRLGELQQVQQQQLQQQQLQQEQLPLRILIRNVDDQLVIYLNGSNVYSADDRISGTQPNDTIDIT